MLIIVSQVHSAPFLSEKVSMAIFVSSHVILNEYFPSDFTEKIMEVKDLRHVDCDVLDQMQITKKVVVAV